MKKTCSNCRHGFEGICTLNGAEISSKGICEDFENELVHIITMIGGKHLKENLTNILRYVDEE